MKATILYLILSLLAGIISGCRSTGEMATQDEEVFVRPIMIAPYTPVPIQVDGLLDDPIWQDAPVYLMRLGQDRSPNNSHPREGGEVRFAWDEEYFYLGVKFYDSDIVADGVENQLHHYELGDVCELFLKPEESPWYWEMFVTPRGKMSTMWWPFRSFKHVEQAYEYRADLKVAVHCEGTLNDSSDTDQYWTAELAMPISALTEKGNRFEPGMDWRVLVARYNYTRRKGDEDLEYSMTPRLSKTHFHLIEEFAVLRLEEKHPGLGIKH